MTPKEMLKALDSGYEHMTQAGIWAKEYRLASRDIMRALIERYEKTFASPQDIAEVIKPLLGSPVLLHPDHLVGVAGYPTDLIAEDIAYHLHPDAYSATLKVNFKDNHFLAPMLLVTKTYEELEKETGKFLKLVGGSENGRATVNLPVKDTPPEKPNLDLPSRFTYMMEESMMEIGRVLSTFSDTKMTVRSFANHMDTVRSDCAIILTKDFFKGKPFTINSLKDTINKNWKRYEGIGAYAMSLDFKYPENERRPGERVYEGYALLVGGTLDGANYALKTYNLAHGKAL